MKGTVITKKCEHCGHHEVGIIRHYDGAYIPLEEQMEIVITNVKEVNEDDRKSD